MRQASTPDTAVQQQINAHLNEFFALPDALNYLGHIFAMMPEESPDVRQRVGLMLKNRVRSDWASLPPNRLADIKAKLLAVIRDPNRSIRSTAGSAITTIIMAGGAGGWPEALTALLASLDDANDDIVDGSFSALCKVCEDETDGLRYLHDTDFQSFVAHHLFPKLFAFCQAGARPVCRKYAIQCLNYFANHRAFDVGEPFHGSLRSYWEALGQLATDPDPNIKRLVCTGFGSLADTNMELILTAVDAVLEFMIGCSDSESYNLRMEAMEFWQPVIQHDQCRNELARFLPKLIPVLLRHTVYTEWDYLAMDVSQIEDDNTAVPDEAHDIGPRFHQSHPRAGQESVDEDEGDDTQRGAWGGDWTVRKSAALALDHLSTHYGVSILPQLLGPIEERLRAESWDVRESAVLCLGAIAQGCMAGLNQFLPKVIELLLTLTREPKPLIRTISCWCISRFSVWICDKPNRDRYFKTVLAEILSHMSDRNKRVQEAACSAFATLEEEARDLLVPYLQDIINTLVAAFNIYQARNVLILYDAIGTLAEAVGSYLRQKQYIEALIPPLIHRLSQATDHDVQLIPIFECLTAVSHALGEDFIPYMEPFIVRCIRTTNCVLDEIDKSATQAMSERPRRDMLGAALDALGAVVEALDKKTPQLLQTHDFIPLLARCCQDSNMQVKQSSFALVGDVSGRAMEQLKPYLPQIMPELTQHLVHSAVSVCNNASWAIGEIAVHGGGDIMSPYVDQITAQLITVVRRENLHRSLLQNGCITLGRLGLVCTAKVAVHLEQFYSRWCFIMIYARNDHEKMNAFHGLYALIKANPSVAMKDIPVLLHSLASIPNPPKNLAQLFHEVITALRQQVDAAAWTTMLNGMEPPIRDSLTRNYGLGGEGGQLVNGTGQVTVPSS